MYINMLCVSVNFYLYASMAYISWNLKTILETELHDSISFQIVKKCLMSQQKLTCFFFICFYFFFKIKHRIRKHFKWRDWNVWELTLIKNHYQLQMYFFQRSPVYLSMGSNYGFHISQNNIHKILCSISKIISVLVCSLSIKRVFLQILIASFYWSLIT